ncbi:hypothetical protein ACFLRN_08065 [Thermoproteota archaeon]
MVKKKWKVLIDFDGILHDTETIFSLILDGLFGLDGKLCIKSIFLIYIERLFMNTFQRGTTIHVFIVNCFAII